jgi:thiol-disulfide isomerase/thioredoxin
MQKELFRQNLVSLCSMCRLAVVIVHPSPFLNHCWSAKAITTPLLNLKFLICNITATIMIPPFLSLISMVACVVSVDSFVVPTRDLHFIRFGSSSSTVLHLFRSKTVDSNVTVIESYVDWLELHEDFDEDEDLTPSSRKMITAVSFHASWCKFCQKFKLKWNRKLVRPLKDTVNFASVDFGANKKLCQSLNINQLPTVQFYFKGKLLSSFPCGPKGFSTLQNTMTKYLEMDSRELEQQALLYEGQASNISGSGNVVPVAIEDDSSTQNDNDDHDDNNFEPGLYLRKRDRLKKKLIRSKGTTHDS